MRVGEHITEKYDPNPAAPLSTSCDQHVAVVSWTDERGPHEHTISATATLGASPAATLGIDDSSVSRVHVELTPSSRGVIVRDLGSRNGTICEPIEMEIRDATLRGDFRLRLGRVEVRVTQPTTVVPTPLWPRANFDRLVGRSDVMRSLFDRLAHIAPSEQTVLLHGESGTGKELVARAIHAFSRRKGQPFVTVDCGALEPDLANAHLFGHARGAFSGAHRDNEGSFEAAEGGTIFLDEIGELPLSFQPILLRALESREIRRVGETQYRKVNIRVVAASHRDLREMVNRGAFREDLYYRLAVIPVQVPALRERSEDIPLLIARFLEEHPGVAMPGEREMARLQAMPWRGNARELRNVVEVAAVLGWACALGDGAARVDAVRDGKEGEGAKAEPASAGEGNGEAEKELIGRPFHEAMKRWYERGKRTYIARLMAKHQRNAVRVAIEGGIDVSYVRKLVKEFGV